ncbi:MAG: VOC family protein [Proteobacteria bacterium]|nr:VOC family protein [Pseudomonadota bacterium]MDA1357899.1 VOC family protein [Pseudomonadota bacterium]
MSNEGSKSSYMTRKRGLGMPGLRGLDHYGMTVPDVETAVDFFCDVLGCEELYKLGTFKMEEGEWMTERLNVHARAEIVNIRMICCGRGGNIELFEYAAPDKNHAQPRNSDNAGHHLCFYVDDIFAAVDYLKSHGVQILGEPSLNSGAEAGEYWCYFLTPWGSQLELVSFPAGRGYEQHTTKRLWDVRDPRA